MTVRSWVGSPDGWPLALPTAAKAVAASRTRRDARTGTDTGLILSAGDMPDRQGARRTARWIVRAAAKGAGNDRQSPRIAWQFHLELALQADAVPGAQRAAVLLSHRQPQERRAEAARASGDQPLWPGAGVAPSRPH